MRELTIFDQPPEFDDPARPTVADVDDHGVVTVRYDDGGCEVIAVMPLDVFRYFRQRAAT